MNQPHHLQDVHRPPQGGRKLVGIALTVIIGLVFLISGVSKLFAMEALEWSIMDLGIPWTGVAGFLARLLIGLELILGGFLVFQIALRRFTLPLTLFLLIVFIVYLLYLYLFLGGEESCGCFGNWITLEPWQSLTKNLVMSLMVLYLIRAYRPSRYRYARWVGLVLLITGLATPMIVDPYFLQSKAVVLSEPISLDPLYAGDQRPEIDLRQGQYVLAFLSLHCGHCQKAAFRLQSLYKQNPNWPIFFILVGPQESIDPFFDDTHARHVPHYYMQDFNAFIEMAGPAVPAIFWIRDGVKERKSHYGQLDPIEIQEWLESAE